MILYMYIAPGLYTCMNRQPPGDNVLMSTEMFCHFIHLLKVLKKMSDFIQFFHDLIHVYSPGAGADSCVGDSL